MDSLSFSLTYSDYAINSSSFLYQLIKQHVSLHIILYQSVLILRKLAIIKFDPLITRSQRVTNIVAAISQLANVFDHAEQSIVSLGAKIARLLENAELQLIAYILVLYCQHVVKVHVLLLFYQFIRETKSLEIDHENVRQLLKQLSLVRLGRFAVNFVSLDFLLLEVGV